MDALLKEAQGSGDLVKTYEERLAAERAEAQETISQLSSRVRELETELVATASQRDKHAALLLVCCT